MGCDRLRDLVPGDRFTMANWHDQRVFVFVGEGRAGNIVVMPVTTERLLRPGAIVNRVAAYPYCDRSGGKREEPIGKPKKTAQETLDEHCERLRAMADTGHLPESDKEAISEVLESHERLLSDMHKIRRTIGG